MSLPPHSLRASTLVAPTIVHPAHSAYTWDELAEAVRRSYVGVHQVLVLRKFINWSESIDPYLNEAAKADGGCSNLSSAPFTCPVK